MKPKTKNKLKVILTIALSLLVFSEINSLKAQPNILFLFSDDHSASDLGSSGNNTVMTPSLDRLAQNGVVFLNAYNMGAWHGAVCVASRLMINTGLSLWRAKAVESNLDSLLKKENVWAKMMENAGYNTFFTGKWHVNMDVSQNFSEMGTLRKSGMPGQVKSMYVRPKYPGDTSWLAWDTSNGGYWEGGKHWSEVVADESIDYLKKQQNDDKPFFMYVAFNAPHDPRQSPKPYYDLYEDIDIPLPGSFLPEHPFKQEMGCYEQGSNGKKWILRDENLSPFPRTDFAVKQHIREYYSIISHMDAQIGRILNELHQTGLAKNTIVIYSSDHGLSVGKHGLLGKQSLYEHSAKPPLIISGPNIPKNEIRKQLVYLQDIMPSVLQWSGQDIPKFIDFKSLDPILQDSTNQSYKTVIGSYRDHQRMVRKGKFKLLLIPKAHKAYLFDLENDPEEIHNLFGNEKYLDVIDNLFLELKNQQLIHGDALEIIASDYH